MAVDIPENEPDTLRAGDTWKWTRTLADYPASAWTLKYRFKSAAGGFEITATASGDSYAITVAASTSAAVVTGNSPSRAPVTGLRFSTILGAAVADAAGVAAGETAVAATVAAALAAAVAAAEAAGATEGVGVAAAVVIGAGQ